jgi:2-dehydro-3-deoxyphosphogluconate aldolase/(4S)-4-hydroxy-2-oxoglutarate aldolase
MKALSGPFGGVRFIPTGGVNAQNLGEYLAAPYVFAAGGSWLCAKKDIAEGRFERIEALCAEAREIALGFELGHIGLNLPDAEASMAAAEQFNKAFGFAVKPGNSSNFAGTGVEVMKSQYLGEHGHIAIRTNSIPRAIAALQKRGFEADMETAKYKGEAMAAVYLRKSFGGFAVHLLQK